MKHSFHIFLLSVTLLWTCVPQETSQHRTLGDEPTTHYFQTESTSRLVLINLPVKSDTRVDLSVSASLPDLPQVEVVRFSGHNEWTREHASFVGSQHLYTQITSSYL